MILNTFRDVYGCLSLQLILQSYFERERPGRAGPMGSTGLGPEGFVWRWYARVPEAVCLGEEAEKMSPISFELTMQYLEGGGM